MRFGSISFPRSGLDAGFGRAFLPKEFEVYGVPMAQRRERFEEAIGMIRRLWTEERVTAHGKYWRLDDVRLMPRVFQRPHPPIWIAAISSEESARRMPASSASAGAISRRSPKR